MSEAFKRAVFADFDESKDHVDAVMEQAAEARASLIHMLFDHVPEDWDENDIGILADAIEEWQASHADTPAPAERVSTTNCLGNKRDEDGYPWICSLPPGHPMKDRIDHKWVRDV